MARKKRAWNMTNPLYRYLNARKGKTSKRKRGVRMTRRKGKSRGGFGGTGRPAAFISDFLMGMGAAATAKRFIGAPLGQYTGAASAAATSFVFNKRGLIAAAAGGFVHDNIGNMGGSGSSSACL